MSTIIQIKNVSKVFKNKGNTVEALKNVNISVSKGDIFGVIGFSGAGKSTLIRLVNLLEKPTSGEVIVNGKNLARLRASELRSSRKNIGMIFQQFNLLNSKTVYENIALPLILNNTPKEEINKRVYDLLEFVGLRDKANTYPSKLSGGQKQRIGIARALATSPSILLCDEATSALDPKTTQSILSLLKRVNRELGITILIITHEMNVIRDICNKVAVMENGEVIEQGEVLEVFGNPKKETTKNFVQTVINDKVPNSIIKSIKEDSNYHVVVRLRFIGENSKRALISEVAKNFNVYINILFATVTELQETTLANIIIGLKGELQDVNTAFEYIKNQNIHAERVELK
ncbi:methionine ABC transporter ATP-binding protein [Clostridium cylindrosporum]|uniref:Methionine import ATP-binding protein MetN 1 n=1 Tax=Clostridium cylindrosporum DSM 605 TaxID=1121307 RepID=A0A0J8D8M7_CLOCY|nr:ATP-binding cassette domain-containing protein [Clostridium cylindrosporum]KMT22415.1 methionine import ATP-binding protein MetN 1 [Clostridium cylindrosporum DSM 605]